MDTTMFQLRSFVHQRLYAAAEEILGEVERTITVALYEAEVSRSKEEVESLRHRLDFLRDKPAADPPPTSTTAGRGDECEAPVPQEDPGPSTPEESDFSLSAKVPGPSQTNADLDANSWNYCFVQADFFMPEIKEEQEGLRDDRQTMFFPPPDIVKSEQDQPETQALYEMQPVSSDDSAAHNESDDSDGFDRKAEQATTLQKKGKTLQGQSGDVNEDKAVLPHDKGSAKGDKGRSLCHFCGKGFKYIGFLMKHLKTHKKHLDCTVCGKTCSSTKRLIAHVKHCHKKTHFCNVCGKTFDNARLLRLHGKIHTGGKEFVCQECGKKFNGRQNLITHVRTHSREKPYHCDICGKAFSQSQNLTIHKRSHSGEKSYQCSLCGKLFKTSGQLKTHMRYHSEEKPYPCDICGKRFTRHGRMTSHRTTHTGERPYGRHVCGMRYRFAPNLKVHLQTHEKAATAT